VASGLVAVLLANTRTAYLVCRIGVTVKEYAVLADLSVTEAARTGGFLTSAIQR
jgi:hypothetical protein